MPVSFIEENEANELGTINTDTNFYVKTINEFDNLKLKCLAQGKPKPTVKWFLKYFNGSSARNLN